jgi:hypothetical protein
MNTYTSSNCASQHQNKVLSKIPIYRSHGVKVKNNSHKRNLSQTLMDEWFSKLHTAYNANWQQNSYAGAFRIRLDYYAMKMSWKNLNFPEFSPWESWRNSEHLNNQWSDFFCISASYATWHHCFWYLHMKGNLKTLRVSVGVFDANGGIKNSFRAR